MTELTVALGATDRLSARTAYDDDSLLRELPTLGRTMEPSAEAILALQPDLFIDATSVHSTQLARTLAQVTIESIVDRDPDYVVVPAGRAQFSSTALQKLPGWRDLVAVRNGRVIEVPAELMERPGLRAFDGAELLRRSLQQGERAR